MDLVMLVPSRNRPNAVRELARAFAETCLGETELVVLVDDDDEFLEDYRACDDYTLRVGPRIRIGPTLNVFAPEYAAQSYAVGFMGDDHRPRTVGWDVSYIHALRAQGGGVVYGNDLIQGEAIPTQVALSSDLVLATGKFVPDGQLHLWLDNAWKTLGQRLGKIKYLPDVVVEHMHPIAGKAEWDAGYIENNAGALFAADQAAFEHWRDNDLATWVEKIRSWNG